MAEDVIEFEILDDGTIKFTTSPVSAVNHATAEEFLRTVARLTGGTTVRQRRTDTHGHQHHDHDHKHEHQ